MWSVELDMGAKSWYNGEPSRPSMYPVITYTGAGNVFQYGVNVYSYA